MNKNNFCAFIALALLPLTSPLFADLATLTQNVSAPLWQHTVLPDAPDPAFELSTMLCTLPGMPATSTLFFSRTPCVARISDIVAINEPILDAYREHLNEATIQEHTTGLQLGQNWRQDQWELCWNWWFGVRERNLWLSQVHRRALREKLSGHETAQSRLTNLWNASHLQAGIGDVHITARYNLTLGSLLALSLGVHATVPVATQQKQSGALETDAATAQETTQPFPTNVEGFTKQISSRARDIMLCAPFGSNGHSGIGMSGALRLHLGDRLKVIAEATSIRFRTSTQTRYALNPTHTVNPAELVGTDMMPIGPEEVSGAERFYRFLYPKKYSVSLVPGRKDTASIHLAYTTDSLHCALGYCRNHVGVEESETAPAGTLRSQHTQQDAIIATASVNTHHGWGDTSSYITGQYVHDGFQSGRWTIGFGATVQA